MRIPKSIIWNVSKKGINQAIHFACKKVCNSVRSYPKDKRGMNPRDITERLDDKIMGDIAESAVLEFLKAEGIKACLYDEIRQDDFVHPDLGWDISLGESIFEWEKGDFAISRPTISGSIRSTRAFLDEGNIDYLINHFGFILPALPGKPIEKCLASDIEIHVFFDKDSYLPSNQRISDSLVYKGAEFISNCYQIDNSLNITQRFGECYLIAWNLKTRIVKDSYRMDRKERKWIAHSGQYKRKMWSAPLRRGRNMSQLADLVKAYEKLK